MRWRSLAGIAVAACLLPSIGRGEDVVYDERGQLFDPRQVLVGDRERVWVHVGGVSPFLRLPNDARGVGTPRSTTPLPFMKSAYAVRSVQVGQRLFVLLIDDAAGIGRETAIGWVAREDMLTRRLAKRDPDSYLAMKCILLNRVESFDKPGEKSIVESFASPLASARGEVVERFPLRALMYVFDVRDSHYLVGYSEEFDADRPLDVVRGWVHVDRKQDWNDRMGLEFDVRSAGIRSTPTIAFKKLEDADRFQAQTLTPKLDLSELDEDDRVSFYEVLGLTEPMTPDQLRYPIIESSETRGDGTTDVLYRAGLHGPLKYDPGHFAELRRIRDKLEAEKLRYRRLNLLFIVDKTKGMEVYADTVSQTISELCDHYREPRPGDYARSVKVAVSTYGDDQEGGDKRRTPFSHSPAYELDDAAAESLSEWLANETGFPGGSLRESVFQGLTKAIAHERGFDIAARNVAIVLGDYGDHSEWGGADGEACKTAFCSRGSAIDSTRSLWELVVVPVVPTATDGAYEVNQAEAERFRDQMVRLCAAIDASYRENFANRDETPSIAKTLPRQPDRGSAAAAVREVLRDVEKRNLDAIATLNAISANGAAGRGGALKSLLERPALEGTPLEETHVFQEGYLWKISPDWPFTEPQVREMALVKESDVREIATLLKRIDEDARRGTQNERAGGVVIDRFLDELIDALSGESVAAGGEKILSLEDWARKRKINVTDSTLFKYRRGGSFRLDHMKRQELHLKRLRLEALLEQLDPGYERYSSVYKFHELDLNTSPVTVRSNEETLPPEDPEAPDDPLTVWKRYQIYRWHTLPGDPHLINYVWLDVKDELP